MRVIRPTVSASHRRFGSLPLAAEKGRAPALQHQLHRVLHSKHAQATSPPCRRATLAGRTVGLIHSPTSTDLLLSRSECLPERRQQLDSPPVHRRMVDRHCPLGHHFFQMTQTQRVGDVPTYACQHYVQREMQPFERLAHSGVRGLDHSLLRSSRDRPP